MFACTRVSRPLLLVGLLLLTAVVQGADVSRQQADSFAKKVAIINQQAERPAAGPRRTTVTESEVNSWFTYRAAPLLPRGVTQPKLTIVGNGKVMGVATVDLEAYGKQKSTGGMFDPWSLLGGRVPVTVTGTLDARGGQGRFNMQEASVGGLPLPKPLLQELVSYYSRSDSNPNGVRLDDPFELPASIQQIDVGSGQATVIQ